MSRRRFFSLAERMSPSSGPRQRSWAECYAGPLFESESSDESGRNSPDQSHTVEQNPSTSTNSSQVINLDTSSSSSPSASPVRDRSRSPVSPASTSQCRRVLVMARTQTETWTEPSSAPTTVPQVQGSNTICSERSHHHGRPRCPNRWRRRRRRCRDCDRLCSRVNRCPTPPPRNRLWGHLPVAIPSNHWHTGVGSRLCVQCRFQGYRRNYTSWLCLECRVPLCLLTWRNCYSQWHTGE